jgi:hypothetical protein
MSSATPVEHDNSEPRPEVVGGSCLAAGCTPGAQGREKRVTNVTKEAPFFTEPGSLASQSRG